MKTIASSEIRDSLKVASRKLRNKFLERIAEEIFNAASSSKNGKVPWGFSAKILRESREQEPWVTKNMISFAYKKYCKKRLLKDTEGTPSDNNPNSCPVTRTGGMPKGATIDKKRHQLQTRTAVKNEITTLYFGEKERYKEKGEMVSNGWLKKTIQKVSEMRGLPESFQVPLSTIRNRRNPICLTDRGCSSLMTPVEPYLVTLICAMAQIRRCLRARD